jgi:large subunit ribosomal protein L13
VPWLPQRKGFLMDMNRAFFMKKEERKPQWKLIDAKGKVLGRLATQLADILRGKDKPDFTHHTDGGDYVVIINAEQIVLTGKKWDDKIYDRYTGWMGGYKTRTARQLRPAELIHLAVLRMLPKNKLSAQIIKKLKVYVGSEHPHMAQLGTPAKASEETKAA